MVDGAGVFTVESAAEGEAEQFGGEVADEEILPGEEGCFELAGSVEARAIGEFAGGVNGEAVFGGPPEPEYVVIFERKAERIEPVMAGRAGRVLAMQHQAGPQCGGRGTLVFWQYGHVGRRGRRGCAQDGIKDPFAA